MAAHGGGRGFAGGEQIGGGGRGGGRGRGGGGGGAHRGGLGQGQGRGGAERGGHRDARRGRGGGAGSGPTGGRGAPPAPRHAEMDVLSGEVEAKMAVAEEMASPAQAAAARREDNYEAVPSSSQAAAAASSSGGLPPASSKAVVFPARPGLGTVGGRCRVRANHFVVHLADKAIYHHDVAITPESKSRERNRTIIKELVRLHQQYMDGRSPVYDGRKGLFTAGPLPFTNREFVVKIANPDRGNQGEKEFKVTIKDAAKLDMYSLKQFLAGRQRELPLDTIQALDIALRECPSSRYISISRSFFSQGFGHGGDIGSGVECWRGYYQSLRPTQMGLSLNIDISATAFYKAQPVINFALEYLNIRDASRRLYDQDRLKLKKALKGVRVVATHRSDKSMRYKITGITSAPFDQDGTRVSVIQYFKRQYNYSLKYTNRPCLQAGSDNRPIYLPMEHTRRRTGILRLACERPAQREGSILEIANRNSYGSDNHAKEFGINVTNQLALIDARVLPAPRLKYHDSGREKVCNPSVGQWNMTNKRMLNGGSIKYWACLTFASRMHLDEVRLFCNNLVGVCNNIGMQINGRPCVDIRQARQDNLDAAVRTIHRQSTELLSQQGVIGQQPELLIIVLPDTNASVFYGRIKRLCETEIGVMSQCCLPKNVQKGGQQYLLNLSLKINVKVVALMDWPEVSKYICLVSSQSHREEIIADLFTEMKDSQKGLVYGGMIRELLLSFYRANGGHKPGRIIFYRDGVSEGQFSQVLLYEMDAIHKACASLEGGYLPPVTFVVVQKRHHTRLFPEDHRARDQMDRSGNILPGTVVDTKICHPSEFDFYLCSHSCIQGTSRPTHYHVLFEESHFSADALQTLTYNLCYTYARCTRSVSIVPPAYYAHLAAFRARHYLDEGHSDQGSSSSASGSRLHDHAVPVKPLPKVKENVKQFMFYCGSQKMKDPTSYIEMEESSNTLGGAAVAAGMEPAADVEAAVEEPGEEGARAGAISPLPAAAEAAPPSAGRGGGRGAVGVPAVGDLSGEMKGKMVVSPSSGGPRAGEGSSPSPVAAVAAQGQATVKMEKEPSQAAAPAATLPPASSKAVTFPARPGFGTVGRRCSIRANHFLVQVVEKLPVYDGRKSIYTAGPLPFQAKEFVVKHTNPGKGNARVDEYKVIIKQASKIDLYTLQQFLAGRQRELPQDTIQALDIALRERPTTKYVSISRSFFSQSFGHGGDIGSGTECWRGYYQSLRPTQMGLSLNIDISVTAFYKAQSVMDFAVQYLNIRDISRRLSDQDRLKLKKALKGVRVVATHRKEKSIRYKITGIPSAPLNELMFDLDGTRISVVQYFKKQYNYSLKYVNWPCLQTGSDSRPRYLPMEVCSILEGQRYSKKLTENQVTSILKLTCERPAQRESSIIEIVKWNSYGNDDCAKEFGIKVANQLALVDARVLPTPRLKYHDSGREKVCNPSIGQWNMINKRMVNGGSINHWACLTFASRMHPNDIRMFCNDLVGMCNNIGMQINTRPCVDIVKAEQRNIEAAIRNIHRQSAEVLGKQGLTGQQLQLLIIILPDVAGTIKRLCDTEVGVITQCCRPRNVQKGGKQYLENLALKINVKVGGRNTVLEDALHRRIPLLTDYPTIVFGADVTHPSPGEDASPSIAAVVASMDWPEVTKYKCLVCAQRHRQEIIADLFTEVKDPVKGIVRGGMIRELLVSFYKATGSKPSRIIFYRDGVSEGQFSQVLLYEMDAIRKACASLQEGYLPRVTFVVVQKRHHTRLFPENHRDLMDRSGNILPGTVVDTKICHPSEFDFYLCSHSGIKGTSRPTHYHVLFDENGFGADTLQTLTYNLCYTYSRCTRAVSIVPPAYYAHLGAFRARYYMEEDQSDQGSSSSAMTRMHERSMKSLPEVKENVKQFMFYC
uniref:Uncharacterized protein n=1 Tax=Leersia perrieri TaxID=77586 RepID=A0A0D9VXH8_9ORYZ